MKKMNAKRALLMSVISMMLCIAMLVGTTYAWFTDSVTTGVNSITSGTLSVDIVDENGATLENGTIYQIIVTVFGGETVLNDAELFAGKRSLCNDDGLYKENVITLIKRFDKAAISMEKSDDSTLDGKIKLYRDIVNQLERLITDA